MGRAGTPDVGGVSSLTTLSPVERLGALRARIAVIGNVPGATRPLLDLSMIHFARWAILEDVPAPDGSGEPWRLNWAQLLFDATYDGPEEEYANAFADLLPQRLIK